MYLRGYVFGVIFIVLLSVSATAFAANDGMLTRIELARRLDRLLTAAGKSPKVFDLSKGTSDVNSQDKPAVARILSAKVMGSYEDKFSPEMKINNFQIAIALAHLSRYLEIAGPAKLPPLPKSVAQNHWSADGVQLAIGLGLIPGGDNFEGKTLMTVPDFHVATIMVARKGNFEAAWKVACLSAGYNSGTPSKAWASLASSAPVNERASVVTPSATHNQKAGIPGLSLSRPDLVQIKDEVEPNDDMATATRLPLNGDLRGTWHASDTFDFYVIDVPQPGQIIVELGGQPAEVKLQFKALGFGDYPDSSLGFENSDEGTKLAFDIQSLAKRGYIAVKVCNIATWQTLGENVVCRCGSSKQWHVMPRKKPGSASTPLPPSVDGGAITGPITYTLKVRFTAAPAGKAPAYRSMTRLKS